MGMGPLIAKWKSRKGTQFSIRLLPIGGYCQFYGEDEDRPDPRAFNNQAVWKRAVTAFSGPPMNFVIAFLAIALFLSLCGVSVVVPKVAKLAAKCAGGRIGDRRRNSGCGRYGDSRFQCGCTGDCGIQTAMR